MFGMHLNVTKPYLEYSFFSFLFFFSLPRQSFPFLLAFSPILSTFSFLIRSFTMTLFLSSSRAVNALTFTLFPSSLLHHTSYPFFLRPFTPSLHYSTSSLSFLLNHFTALYQYASPPSSTPPPPLHK